MSKNQRQDLKCELPLMQLAADLTKFSDTGKGNHIVEKQQQRQLKKCLVDTSLLIDIFERSRSQKKKEDNVAFETLLDLARARKIELLVNPSLADEWKRIGDEAKVVINEKTKNAFSVSAEGVHLKNGLRPYITTWPEGTFDDPSLDQAADLASDLPDVDKDPSINKEDRNHFCWACINRLVFLTTDYKFIKRVAKAIPRQIEKFASEEWQLPINRVPLRAAAMRPKSYLETLLTNQIVKELGPMSPPEVISRLKQLAEVANNHRMGSGHIKKWVGPLLGQPGQIHPILDLISDQNDEVINDHIQTIAGLVGHLHQGNKNAEASWHGNQSEIVGKLKRLILIVEREILDSNQQSESDQQNPANDGINLFPKGLEKIENRRYIQAARELYANFKETGEDCKETQIRILRSIFGNTDAAEAARKRLDRYEENGWIRLVWKQKKE